MKIRRGSIRTLSLGIAVLPFPAQAQEASRIPRVGYLSAREAPEARDEAFRQGLHALGRSEGKRIAVGFRSANGVHHVPVAK